MCDATSSRASVVRMPTRSVDVELLNQPIGDMPEGVAAPVWSEVSACRSVHVEVLLSMAQTTFADKPTIIGDRVILRPVTGDDAEAFFSSLDDEETIRLTGTHASFTFEQIEAWTASRADAPDRLDLSIIDKESGAWVGELAILDWDKDNHSCGFRIAIGPEGRNRGLGSEATRLIVDYVFEHLPINRIGLEVFAFNPRAIHVYERAGFTREGVHRAALYWDGEYHDSILMSILRDEWASRRSRADDLP